tara:strand:- start:4556 stop:5734 length:1179 start_codon:yes stop_codon:yes gene_type:complete
MKKFLFCIGLSLLCACHQQPGPSTTTLPSDEAPQPILFSQDAGSTEMDSGRTDAGPSTPIELFDSGLQSSPVEDSDAGTDAGFLSVNSCFADIYDPTVPGPDYDQFMPTVGSHCAGTQHQNIQNVERVVFLGDSVTMGSPPTESGDFYRNRLTDWLANRFGLSAPNGLWERYNPLDGEALVKQSGDFWNCARWGARTDDLMEDNSQVMNCFPQEERNKKTLVVLTIGGNDISNLTQNGYNQTYEHNLEQTENFVRLLSETIEWLKNPDNVPGGTYVVFGNMFEFTDGTGDIGSCPTSSFAGFEDWEDTQMLEELVIWANEQFLSIAVDTGSDMVFMLESFCGHGFNHDNPQGRCYRGPNTERWFDLTCIHPNPSGHSALADLFQNVIAGDNN